MDTSTAAIGSCTMCWRGRKWGGEIGIANGRVDVAVLIIALVRHVTWRLSTWQVKRARRLCDLYILMKTNQDARLI